MIRSDNMSNFNFSLKPSNKNSYPKREPFRPINIADIKSPGKYRIFGSIISVSENSFEVNDGTDQIRVIPVETASIDEVSEGMQVRILGEFSGGKNKQIEAIIIQNWSSVDIQTYNGVKDLEASLFR